MSKGRMLLRVGVMVGVLVVCMWPLVKRRGMDPREALRVTAEERKELDAELDGIIAELHGRSRGINEREATRDVEEAMEAVRNA